jgi:hypothetical protein
MSIFKLENLPEKDKDTHSGGGLMKVGASTIDGGAPRMWWRQPR